MIVCRVETKRVAEHRHVQYTQRPRYPSSAKSFGPQLAMLLPAVRTSTPETSMNDQDGKRERRDRWLDIALYAASAFVITILAGQLSLAVWMFDPLAQFVASAIAVVLFISFTSRWANADSILAALGAKHFHRYPPIWLAAILAFSTALLYLYASDADSPVAAVQRAAVRASLVPLYCVAGACVCAVAARGLRWHNPATATKPIQLPADVAHTSETDSVEALLRWLNDDNPISSPFDDRFRHHLLAKRIATRLLDMESRPSVLLHGALGAGKTGVARLVEHELRQTSSIRFIRISVWGHSTAESAVGGILGALVDSVATEASGLALRGVPAQYLDAIAQHGGAFASIARLAHTERQPEKVLARIDTIAKAIQIHFIVWVEDLERLRRDDSQPKMEANDAQLLGPIRAFLYLLHECGNIQVVIADAQRDTGVDFEKIARYTEVVPSIQRREVCRVLGQVRTILLPSSIIDPAAPDHRRKLKPIAEHDIEGLDRWLQQMGTMHSVPSEFIVHVAVADLLDTPRTMKQSLRSARRTADVLKGEIDPDAILAISVIRTTHRRVFEIINDYIEAFRSGFPKPPNLDTHSAISQLETYLKEREERVGKAIKALLRYLFPNYNDAGQNDPLAYVANPQGLHVNRHRDNWRAYLDERIDDQSWSDQRALWSIREWRDGNPIALDPYLGSRAGHTQLGTFVGQFGGSDLLNLLRQIATDDSAAAPQNNAATSEKIWLVRSMMAAVNPDSAALVSLLEELITRSAKINLPLAIWLANRFYSSTPHIRPLFDSQQWRVLRRHVRDEIAKHFNGANAAGELIRALKSDDDSHFAALCDAFDPLDTSDPLVLPAGLAAALIEAARRDPSFGVPIISTLLAPRMLNGTDPTSDDEVPRRCSPLRLERISSFEQEALRTLLNQYQISALHSPSDLRPYIQQAQDWART
jgi:hypothetical protein